MVDGRLPEADGRENGRNIVSWVQNLLGVMESFGNGWGDGSTASWRHTMPQNCTLKSCLNCVFYYIFFTTIKQKEISQSWKKRGHANICVPACSGRGLSLEEPGVGRWSHWKWRTLKSLRGSLNLVFGTEQKCFPAAYAECEKQEQLSSTVSWYLLITLLLTNQRLPHVVLTSTPGLYSMLPLLPVT